jgi:hypothetical protein
MNMIGASFLPAANENLRRHLNESNFMMGPMAHQAMKVLSMRLPEILSGRQTAPRPLSDLVSRSLAPGLDG